MLFLTFLSSLKLKGEIVSITSYEKVYKK